MGKMLRFLREWLYNWGASTGGSSFGILRTMSQKQFGLSIRIMSSISKQLGAFAVTTSKDKTMHIIDTRSKSINRIIRSKHSTWFNALDISDDGKFIMASNFDNYVVFYDMSSAKVLRTLRVHNVGNLCVKLVRNGRLLLIGTQDGHVQVIRL